MSVRRRLLLPASLLAIFAVSNITALGYANDLKPEELVGRHLDSIGTASARSAIESRVVQGKLAFKILVGGSGTVFGTWGRVSENQKSNFVMRFGQGDYRGEQFVFDGNRAYIAANTSGHTRSSLGDFVHSQDYIVKEGLLGGVLSTAWALQHLDESRAKLSYGGLKNVDGRQLYDLEYHTRQSSDMRIHLYFDPETYRHVKTVYSMSFAPHVGPSITTSVDQQQIRYSIQERFDDYKTENGITLPSTYSIEFSEELQNGRTLVFRWDMTADKTAENVGLDPKNFETK